MKDIKNFFKIWQSLKSINFLELQDIDDFYIIGIKDSFINNTPTLHIWCWINNGCMHLYFEIENDEYVLKEIKLKKQ